MSPRRERDALHDFLIGRRVTPAPLAGRQVWTPDGEEQPVDEALFDHSAGRAVYIVYIDNVGHRSERPISVRQIIARGWPESIYAFCHVRRALRQFRIDRIKELYDLSTGELREAEPYLEALFRNGAVGRRDDVLCHLARTLVFMARCDGDYHPLEEEAIEFALGRYLRNYGGDDDDLDDIMGRCDELAPEGVNVLSSLGHVIRCPERRAISRLILDAVGSVIDADGRHAPEEVTWAVELSSLLREAANGQTG